MRHPFQDTYYKCTHNYEYILHGSAGSGFVIGEDQAHARPLIIANSFIENGILNWKIYGEEIRKLEDYLDALSKTS